MNTIEIIGVVTSGLAAAKGALDVLQGVESLGASSEDSEILSDVKKRVAEVQDSLLRTQTLALGILKDRDQFERELLAEREQSDLLKNYALVEVRQGLHLYQNGQGADGPGAVVHYACPNCFNQRRVSVLQRLHPTENAIKCPSCPFACDIRSADDIHKPQAIRGPKRIQGWR
jgi:hypothetical protein